MLGAEDILGQLKVRGFRLTKVRKSILDVITNNAKPLTYFEIKKTLGEKRIFADKTTIYRELNFLKAQSFVRELHLRGNAKYYEMTPENHHHHIVCNNCENIDHIELKKDLAQEEKEILKNKKFKIFNHSLEFYGLCQKCQ